jgi:CubicO group peptidase (beta-lactamase class C family)
MANQLVDGRPEAAGMSSDQLRVAAQRADQWVKGGLATGVVVLVARRGRIVLHEAFGRLTTDPGAPPLPTDAIFPIASIDKPITATTVMCLVDNGLVDLNDPVQKYIPEFVGEGKERVLVHHLLTHTSGLRDEDAAAHGEQKKLRTTIPPPPSNLHPDVAERLFLWSDAPLWKPPGTEMSYCGFGFNLLSEIVRRVSGQAQWEFAADRIFRPLGMNDTSLGLPNSKRERFARRYSDDGTALTTAFLGYLEDPAYQEAWGVHSTARDLAVFGQMYLQGGSYGATRILSPSTIALMTRNHIPSIPVWFGGYFFAEGSWGFGWEIQGEKHEKSGPSRCSPRTFSHPGGGGTYIWVDPVTEVVGIFFSLRTASNPSDRRPFRHGGPIVDAITAAICQDGMR